MYADYDFYLNTYFGNAIAEEDFPRLSARASDYVRAATGGVSDTVDGWQLEAVKKAACAVADVLLDEETMTSAAYSAQAQVASETVGPWTKSYRSTAISSADAAYAKDRKLEALTMYLGGLAAFAGIFRVRSYPCAHCRL